jgi:hypothetical protein
VLRVGHPGAAWRVGVARLPGSGRPGASGCGAACAGSGAHGAVQGGRLEHRGLAASGVGSCVHLGRRGMAGVGHWQGLLGIGSE